MATLASKIEFAWLFIMSLLWIYIAVRLGGRAVIRTHQEYKNKLAKKGASYGSTRQK